jgi:hypothetical protein
MSYFSIFHACVEVKEIVCSIWHGKSKPNYSRASELLNNNDEVKEDTRCDKSGTKDLLILIFLKRNCAEISAELKLDYFPRIVANLSSIIVLFL